jgi:DNA-binding CsgD family transcriptional regulator
LPRLTGPIRVGPGLRIYSPPDAARRGRHPLTPEKQALPLIERIYEAALDQSAWQAFVEGLSDAYGGASVGFALQVPGYPSPEGAMFAVGFRPEFRAVFAAHVARGLPWDEARRKNFVGRFGLASEVFPDSEVCTTDYYKDWMEPQGLSPVGPIGHTIALEGDTPVATVVLFRTEPGGPWRPRDLVLADLLVPHLAQAYRIHAQVRENAALAEALDRLPTGVVLLDARGQRILANRSADYILSLGDGLSLDKTGPHAVKPSEDATLQEMLRAAVRASTTGQVPEGSVMAVSRPSGRRSFPIMLTPLLSTSSESALSDAVAVLYVSDVEAHSLPRSETLRSLYSLTGAEIELVELLCDGASLEEAADRRGVTMNTARSQLKQIFMKTSTGRQSELVRLVLSGIAPIRTP